MSRGKSGKDAKIQVAASGWIDIGIMKIPCNTRPSDLVFSSSVTRVERIPWINRRSNCADMDSLPAHDRDRRGASAKVLVCQGDGRRERLSHRRGVNPVGALKLRVGIGIVGFDAVVILCD